MSQYFHCKLCDKSIKSKSKKKHLNCQGQQALTNSINSRCYITYPNFLHIEDILKKYVYDQDKKFGFYMQT